MVLGLVVLLVRGQVLIPGRTTKTVGGMTLGGNSLDVYTFAVSVQDYPTAIAELVRYIVQHPSEVAFQDTLIALYYKAGRYNSAINLSAKVMQERPDDLLALEYKSMSLHAAGRRQEALGSYSLLYDKTKKIYHLYQIASLQYQLVEDIACKGTIRRLLEHPELEMEKVNIWANGSHKFLPMKAAVYNLKGNVDLRNEDLKEAESAFRKALEVEPDFQLAKNNLELLKQR